MTLNNTQYYFCQVFFKYFQSQNFTQKIHYPQRSKTSMEEKFQEIDATVSKHLATQSQTQIFQIVHLNVNAIPIEHYSIFKKKKKNNCIVQS